MSFSRASALQGVRDVAPILLGVVPFGLVAGVAAVAVGLPRFEAIAISVLVFAGASQLAGLQLIGDGAPAGVIWLTTLMINLRFLMYSASIAPWLKRLRTRTRTLLAYLLTDQAYALSVARFRRAEPASRRDYYLGVAGAMWLTWMTATSVGVLVGAQVPPAWGLDFAIPLTFMALLFPMLRDRPSLLAALVGGALAVALRALPLNLGLVTASLAGIAAGAVAERAAARRRAPEPAEPAADESAPPPTDREPVHERGVGG